MAMAFNTYKPGNRIPQGLPPRKPNPLNPSKRILLKLAQLYDLYRDAVLQGGGPAPSMLSDPELVEWVKAIQGLPIDK
jgi:hypothetical protein